MIIMAINLSLKWKMILKGETTKKRKKNENDFENLF